MLDTDGPYNPFIAHSWDELPVWLNNLLVERNLSEAVIEVAGLAIAGSVSEPVFSWYPGGSLGALVSFMFLNSTSFPILFSEPRLGLTSSPLLRLGGLDPGT